MAPITTRQLFVLNLPAIAILLSYFWFRRKRIGAPSDPGDKKTPVETDAFIESKKSTSVPLDIKPRTTEISTSSSVDESPCGSRILSEEHHKVENSPNKFSRSFSAPIPIVLPKEVRLSKALNISDEELDQHIEKLKSVKKTDPFSLISQGRSSNSCSISPIQLKDSVESKIGENNNQVIIPDKEHSVEEIAEEVVSPCEEVVEEIEPISDQQVEQELVASSLQGTEEIIPTNSKEVPEETVSPCEEVVEEIDSTSYQNITVEKVISIAEEMVGKMDSEVVQKATSSETDSPQSSTDILKETDSSSSCNTSPKSDSSWVEMASASNNNVVQETDSPGVDNENEISSSVENDLVAVETVSVCVKNKSDKIVYPTGEDVVASSAEHSVSTNDVQNEQTSPGTRTGAIPKQLKKKKFRKLDCNPEDLGNKLQETHMGSGSKVRRSRRDGQKSRSDSGCEREEMAGPSSCRESANVSPSDTMMAACGSLDSLNSSEGSNDSGKGCSDTTTPPPQPNTFYEFLLPVDKVGKLIGKRGCFINRVYTETNAHIVVKDHPSDNEKKICIVEGTEDAIHKAMAMVKQRFPREKLKPFIANTVPPVTGMEPNLHLIYAPLSAGVNNETVVTCLLAPDHLFVQQPYNPTFHNFQHLHKEMQKAYVSDDAPLLPKPVIENTLCVAYMANGWSRVWIMSADQETEMAYVRCMDFGGYEYVPFNQLKQIRRDFFYVAFQAVECFLANIEPVTDVWPEEAYELIRELTKGLIFTHIVDFTPDLIPLVNIQVLQDKVGAVWVNEQLVAHGFARWTPQAELEFLNKECDC